MEMALNEEVNIQIQQVQQSYAIDITSAKENSDL
jgi:predicted RNA-binding protein with TRAM domain